MGLVKYKSKRKFNKTPEPKGGKAAGKKLVFVVQKHQASSLHYDFRLELKGVLLSWAIPKGPSLDPANKRLAMLVEDHPYDYKDFEGIIPEGNYGAGAVIVWDQGTYEPIEDLKSKAEQEKKIAADFKKGSLKIRMHGQKLKGEFALVRTKTRGENSWLLIKHRDDFASKKDIGELDYSVVSGKSLDEVAGDEKSRTWGSTRLVDYDKMNKGKKNEIERIKKRVAIPMARVQSKTKLKKSAAKIIDPQENADRKTFLNPQDETQVRKINGHELKFTNLSKIYWPEEGYTKRDMLNYYYQIAPVMLPYLSDRPQTLNRFPNGIHGKSFYQKDVTGKVPDWIDTYEYFSHGDQRKKHFLVCTNEESLLYIASLGCIELNPWSSRTGSPDNPDFCIIDLDPDKKNTFDQVVKAAQVTRQILDVISVPSYCKTSGSTGLHIYIPLRARYTYEESKEFGRALVKIVNNELPAFTSIERKVSERNGKMYLDFLQNRPQATVAGPYSLRPKPGAPVSMPLHWDEVKKGLTIQKFNLKNAVARVRSEGDLFSGVLDEGVDMNKAMTNLVKTFGKVNE